MNIKIKNLKVAEFASEETLCFECSVYVDGKRAFTAHNDGRGGCNYYDPIKGQDYQVERDAEAYAQTLPPIPPNPEWEWDTTGLDYDLDLLIGDLVTKMQDEKEVKSKCRKWIVLRDKNASDNILYDCVIKQKFVPERHTKALQEKYPDDEIVNLRYL